MNLADFDYSLPPDRIAQTPMEPRDHSKLMKLNRIDQTLSHHHFYDLVDMLTDNDVLVFNHSRVIPARLSFVLNEKPAEILLLKPLAEGRWEAMVRPGKRFRVGDSFRVNEELGVSIVEVRETGERILEFDCEDFSQYLKKKGEMPTPPYIQEKLNDPERYQTVYSKPEGSVAAPTAGLHFTPELLEKLKQKGVQQEFVTLNVGLGTFQPVKTQNPLEHKMHHEWFDLSEGTAERLNRAKERGKRIIAVGTTTVRVLETCAREIGESIDSEGVIPSLHLLQARSGETNIFIYPGYQWKFVDSLITNFHVPKSTLLMLVSSFTDPSTLHHPGSTPPFVPQSESTPPFVPQSESTPPFVSHSESAMADEESPAGSSGLSGREFILKAYQEAIENNYRFFSFGDAMWIV